MEEATPEQRQWTNWSGNLTANPDRIVKPTSEAELLELVRECRSSDETIRVAGSGHSWTPVAATDDVLVSLEELTGIEVVDRDAHEAVVEGGTTLESAALALHRTGLAMPNLGDVSQQTIAGAFCTGTHGTGQEFRNLSDMLIGGRLITGTGEVREFGREDIDFLDAARVSLGTLGIFTELRLDLQPTYKLERREYCTAFEAFWEDFDRLVEENRQFDFYWYPRSDEVKLRLLNGPGGGTDESMLDEATEVTRETGWWHQTIPAHDDIGREFEEMEYGVAREQFREWFLDIRERVREHWRATVGWRLLVRTVASDDAYLSTEYGRDTATVGFIQNAQLEYENYFEDLESLTREYDGRPHWGKRHTLRAPALRDLYPQFDAFCELRGELDPDGVFLTDYLQSLLGTPSGGGESGG